MFNFASLVESATPQQISNKFGFVFGSNADLWFRVNLVS